MNITVFRFLHHLMCSYLSTCPGNQYFNEKDLKRSTGSAFNCTGYTSHLISSINVTHFHLHTLYIPYHISIFIVNKVKKKITKADAILLIRDYPSYLFRNREKLKLTSAYTLFHAFSVFKMNTLAKLVNFLYSTWLLLPFFILFCSRIAGRQ
jgi:hypothetical protein